MAESVKEPPKNSISVPIRVDAMWSDGSTYLSPPTTDFSKLQNTIYGSSPWLGDTSHLLPNNTFVLPEGLHLHWTLPEALRHGNTVYVLDYSVFNELVQQGVPCSIVEALKNKSSLDNEYTLDELNKILIALCSANSPPLAKSGFTLLNDSIEYQNLISSDENIKVTTKMPKFSWDPVFFEIYSPMVISLAARMKLPPVPNRWLVIRKDTSGNNDIAWVVESDRLTPPDSNGSAPEGAGPVCVPGEFDAIFDPAKIKPSDTFQYLGKTFEAANWQEDDNAKRFSPLTAVGHGIADFAAFYPNCRGVFGFHDKSAEQNTIYEYTVIGWFASETDDPLSVNYKVSPWAEQAADQAERIELLGWELDNPDWDNIEGSLYTAKVRVMGDKCCVKSHLDLNNVGVAIGNTAAEALSAYIATGENNSTLGITSESILNAVQVGVLQKALEPDGPAVIENSLHEQSFQTESGGWIWQITGSSQDTSGLSDKMPTDTEILLSGEAARALNDLNKAQAAFDREQDILRSERHLLFTDWFRAAHLNSDAQGADIFPNVETTDNNKLQLCQLAANTLTTAAASLRAAGRSGDSDNSMPAYSAMQKLYLAHTEAVNALKKMADGDQGLLLLRRQPGPRYWRPNDPVIMMTETTGNDLEIYPVCDLPVNEGSSLILKVLSPGKGSLNYLSDNWDKYTAVPSTGIIETIQTQIELSHYDEPSWRPLSLYWDINFYHSPEAGNITYSGKEKPSFKVTDYNTGFITDNFSPDPSGIDYKPQKENNFSDHKATYIGRVTLSSFAEKTMRSRILQLTGQIENPPDKSDALTLPGALNEGITKELIKKAYDSNVKTLSQVLSGFNDQLLMLNRVPQISIFDPHNMKSWDLSSAPSWDSVSQSFYDEIGLQRRTSPEQDDIYNPIRAGKCEITKLTLVDAFGQIREWSYSDSNTIISEALPNETAKIQNPAPAFFLPPRLCQGSRLLFRWLTADGSDDAESNQSPATTPICGWMALNRVDENIMIFTKDGILIGWIPAGGGDMIYMPNRSPKDIEDTYLNQVVKQMQVPGNSFFGEVDNALLTIEPRAHITHSDCSILESRPLALARASLQLQLYGSPSPHQGYEALATMKFDDNNPVVGTNSPYIVREDCGFSTVNFPLRLGDVSMDDDGLLLYWQITEGKIDKYTLVGTEPEARHDKESAINLSCAPDSKSVQALLLLDPRAPVHVTSGILPVKEITIPSAMYANAVNKMEFLMRTGPVLTPDDTVAMPLPSEISGKWSWIHQAGESWSAPKIPQKIDAKIHPKAKPAVIRNGFLKAGADKDE